MYAAAMRPETRGSSEKASKLRPPRGDLCPQTVGPSSTYAPLVCVSVASAWPILRVRDLLKVAAIDTQAGKHAAVVPSRKVPPRAPFGPSLNFNLCQ